MKLAPIYPEQDDSDYDYYIYQLNLSLLFMLL